MQKRYEDMIIILYFSYFLVCFSIIPLSLSILDQVYICVNNVNFSVPKDIKMKKHIKAKYDRIHKEISCLLKVTVVAFIFLWVFLVIFWT